MEHLGQSLPVLEPEPLTATAMRTPQYLNEIVRLPSTDKLRAELQSAQERLEQARPGTNQYTLLARDVEFAHKRISWGEERDALHGERPDGCFCLGSGGRGLRYLNAEEWTFDEYCECPEGRSAKLHAETVSARLRAERQQRRVRQLFEGAGIPQRFALCSFETYPANEATRELCEQVRRWATPPPTDDEFDRWWNGQKRSLFLYGPFGTGKTGLAVSALRQLAQSMAESCLFVTVPNLLDRIRQTYHHDGTATESDVLQAVKSVDVLVLDDLGAERVTDWVAEKLFTIINHRHDEDLTTIFTSNLTMDELGGHIGERTTWRIVEMCDLVRVDGPNLRDRA